KASGSGTGKGPSDIAHGRTGETVLLCCRVRDEEEQRLRALPEQDRPKERAGDQAFQGHHRQPTSPQGVVLMASKSIRGIIGWGNLLVPCQALLDRLRPLGEV